MPDLFDTLIGRETAPDGSLTFPRTFDHENIYFGIVDYVAGQTTRAQIIAALNLDVDQIVDLDALLATVDAIAGVADKVRWMLEFQAVLHLARAGYKYTTKAEFRTRLGI